jgi:predicted PurR-regulated permease PerM
MSAVILLWLILALLIIIVGYLIFGSKTKQDNESVGLIKQDLTNLSQGLDMLKDSLNKGLSDNNQQMQRSLSSQLQTSSRLVADVTQRG